MKNKGGKLGMLVGLIAALAASASAATDSSLVVGWPEASRIAVRGMTAKHGQPNLKDADSMTWYGLYRGRRTVIHLADGTIEQVVLYRVPADKVSGLMSFDGDIVVDREKNELSVISGSVKTNFLLLNLSHDIASGYITTSAARELFQAMARRGKAGETVRYLSSIAFEAPLPRAVN